MSHLLFIFSEIILPVFILIGVGALLQKKFKLDLYTLSKLNIYYLSPAIIFSKLYSTNLPIKLFFGVLLFTGILTIIMYTLSRLISRLLKHDIRKKTAFTHSIIFYNSGNFGVPVNDLVFRHDPFAASIQIAVMVFQNVAVFSYGVFTLNSLTTSKLKALLQYFKMPLFYALVLGLTFNVFNVKLPSFIETPVEYAANALIAIALLTLGCQIGNLKPNFKNVSVYISMATRLLLAPAIAFCILKLIGLEGLLAQALLVSTAMPTAVNSSIIAQEYNNEPEYAAQVVVGSTLLCSITLTFVIYVAMNMF